MIALFLLGYGLLALIACPVAVALYRVADRVHEGRMLERMTRTPWDDAQ